jgi:tRNA nucleotidyltransferase (CCA-adding enzyme)
MSDYNFLMESRLSPEQYEVLVLISRLAAQQGLNLYLVGGAVRDLTYGQQVVRDLDFAVEGPPQRILRLIPTGGSQKPRRGESAPLGKPPLALVHQVFDARLNAAELHFSNGVRAELAMCRDEFYPRPGQRPEVRPVMVFEDLKRRDFAINAMAVSLHPNSRGLLLDPTNGAGDIERRELRALHSRSFLEDPLRIFRLLRLGSRLDFKPDERTQRWFDTAVEARAWEHLDNDQQARELAAILYEDHPGRVLKMLAERKLLPGLDKKLASARIPYDRFARIRSALQNVPGADPFLLNFHCFVEKLGSDHTSRLAKKIVGDSKAIKLALSFNQDARKLQRALCGTKAKLPSQVYALLSPLPRPLLLFLLANSARAKVQNRVKSFLFKFPGIRARLPRGELQSLGMKPGPEFDRILDQIFLRQLDGKIKTHQQLMKELRALAGIKEPPPPPPPHPVKKAKEPPPVPPPPLLKKGKEAAAAPPPEAPAKPAGKGGAPKAAGKPGAKHEPEERPAQAAKPVAQPKPKEKPAKEAKQAAQPRAAKKPEKPAKAAAKPAKVVAKPAKAPARRAKPAIKATRRSKRGR